MAERKRPTIFDMFNDFWRGTPFEGEEQMGADIFGASFEDLIRKMEQGMPQGFEDMVTEEKTPEGTTRRYGPFVYGFSCTAEPGEEPVYREFGNIKPSARGLQPSQEGRLPLVDVMDEQDKYRIFVELPGVDKNSIKLDASEDSVEVKTTDDKKFYKMIDLPSEINPDSAKASYNNGVLTINVDKKEKRVGKEINIE